ncbi:MAG: signal recognition particle protein [Flammeovirgaceae bacterium]|nr:signal recognition particle protein [Flammeovirgaceae bacterium]|tara:strand:- start:165 stop:1493 length:1329 start_codon:yes stop_codon:yes gene_type:complete
MFENLSNKLDRAFKVLKGQGRITEINIASTIKEIRRALIDADVSYKVAKEITSNIKDKAMGQNVLISVSPGQLLTKIVADELTDLMGGESAELSLDGNPNLILLSGLQGSGKTTFCGKLGKYLTNKGKKTLMVACDVYRPAAIEQLHVIGDDLKIEVFSDKKSKSPLNIAKKAIQHAKSKGFKSVIIDTAGRLAIDEEMMKEIKGLKSNLKPQETLFVVDSMIGQDAVLTAKTFNEAIDYDGVVLTKLDGDSRGGSALSIRKVVNKPIKFISTGEKMDALDVFHPDRMAKRILGMGDVISLVERAQQNFDEEEARKLQKKMFENTFGLDDFLSQIQKIKKMGNIKDLIGMMPGVSSKIKDADIDDESFKPIESIIFSMTPVERKNPDILNGNRKKRIAMGSGTSVQEVNQLLKQFNQMRKMMKMMKKSGPSGMMSALGLSDK